MKVTYKYLYFTLLALSIISCNTQKRCARFVKNHPDCFKSDTIIKIDTVVTYEHGDTTIMWRDSVITLVVKGDTVKIANKVDRLRIQYSFRDTGKIVTRTITKSHPIEIKKPRKTAWLNYIYVGLVCFVVGYLIRHRR